MGQIKRELYDVISRLQSAMNELEYEDADIQQIVQRDLQEALTKVEYCFEMAD